MRIGVISDTHRGVETALQAVSRMGHIDLLLHAGDHYRDAVELTKQLDVPVRMVIGNCDTGSAGPDELVVEAGSARILLVHGHQYSVKSRLDSLLYRGQELGVQAVVFGHSHHADVFREQSILFLNPGTLSLFRSRDGCQTYGIITVDGTTCNGEIFTLARYS